MPSDADAFGTSDVIVVIGGAEDSPLKVATYDPTISVWSISNAEAPMPAQSLSVRQWIGDGLFVWGGGVVGPEAPLTGAVYAPGSDSWRLTAPAPFRTSVTAVSVFTGNEVLVWGGPEGDNRGLAYDIAADSWRILPPSPIPSRMSPGATWTGTEFIVWGGCATTAETPDCGDRVSGSERRDGAAYDPAANSWRVLPPSPISGRADPVVQWTGREVVIWGGTGDLSTNVQGAAYAPSTGNWREIANVDGVVGHDIRSMWTGTEVLVIGQPSPAPFGLAYDPDEDSWRPLPEPPFEHRLYPATTWTGRAAFVWGGCCGVRNLGPYYDGGLYTPSAGATD